MLCPDVYVLGKALGGGAMPISAVVADKEILGLFEPGSHGSTFGGNPLACACAISALEIIEEENLVQNSLEMGNYFMDKLKQIKNPIIKEVRGKGLFIGLELFEKARPYCEKLMEHGLLCKDTHENVIRFAPPLIITKEEIDWAMERIKKCCVLKKDCRRFEKRRQSFTLNSRFPELVYFLSHKKIGEF